MTYKYLSDSVVAKVDVDGVSRSSCTTENPQFIEWLASGNTPLPADPLPPPVATCTPWQIRKALNLIGLRDGVEVAIAASDDQALKDGWEFASEFRSDDPLVIGMGAMLGKTEAETFDLIKAASSL